MFQLVTLMILEDIVKDHAKGPIKSTEASYTFSSITFGSIKYLKNWKLYDWLLLAQIASLEA